MRRLKTWLALGLSLCLLASLFTGAAAETTSDSTQEPQEIHMAAVGAMITVPAGMETLEGDEAAYDLGFRYDGYTDNIDLSIYVQDARDMTLKDYAAFYAGRNNFSTVKQDNVNGFPIYRLTNAASPDLLTVLLGDPTDDTPNVAYVLAFSCEDEKAWQQEDSILQTLANY
jgi:hypothetical protein